MIMFPIKYRNQIRKIISELATGETKAFIFGSSLGKGNFNDIDIGILDQFMSEKTLSEIRNRLEESRIPYTIDIVHMNTVDKAFRNKVLKEKIVWLIP